MSESNGTGVIKIGRKGRKKFQIGDLPVFDVDVVDAFQAWIIFDESFRPVEQDKDGNRPVPNSEMPQYHATQVALIESFGGEAYHGKLTKTEALEFVKLLREQFNEMAVFFRAKSPDDPDSPATSEAQSELEFSVEGETPS